MADDRTKSRTTDTLFDLTGRVAIVTGASRGIGARLAQALDEAGCRVALVARTKDALEGVAASMTNDPLVIAGDIGDADVPGAVVAEVEEAAGRVDIVINNAGMPGFGDARKLDVELWDRVHNVNLRAPFLFARAAAPGMIERGYGKIVNVASVIAFAADGYASPYAASKTGVLGLTRSLAIEWGRRGIQVNALAPGWVATELNEGVRTEEFDKRVIDAIPASRWGETDDMVGPVLFLCSPASNYVTGQTLIVDGGLLAKW
jgi:NAD(P)-dependent dehydrogenase (short-subunit alcohol dehydrogenase family)